MSDCKTEKPLRRSTPTSAVLFDLGNTLAAYYRRDEFQPILERAVDNVLTELRAVRAFSRAHLRDRAGLRRRRSGAHAAS